MARSSTFELNFFSMEKKDSKPPVFQRRRSFRDIQGVITKMNPELVKSVMIANGCLGCSKSSISVPPKDTQMASSLVPLYDPTLSVHHVCEDNDENTAPMTIFYNGIVAVFEVSPHHAKGVFKVAREILPNKSAEYSELEPNLLESLSEDLPVPRKNSLQRFLEKRKERLTTLSPYYFPGERCYACQSSFYSK